jgi:hypothetical protein
MAASSASTMRTAALPSHPSGARGATAARGIDNISEAADTIPCTVIGHGTMRFVPSATVTGRSVLSRKVRHGTPRTVVSS